MSAAHVADTGFIAALGGPENERYRRVRTFAQRNGVVFMLPERVYDELTASDTEDPHVDTAIAEGWVQVAPSLNYTDSLVSKTMDSVQRYTRKRLSGRRAQASRNMAGQADSRYHYLSPNRITVHEPQCGSENCRQTERIRATPSPPRRSGGVPTRRNG